MTTTTNSTLRCQRKKFLWQLEQLMEFNMNFRMLCLSCPPSSSLLYRTFEEEDTTTNWLIFMYYSYKQKRYTFRKPFRTHQNTKEFELDLALSDGEPDSTSFLNEVEFLQKYCMRRESFYKLADMIQEHPVF